MKLSRRFHPTVVKPCPHGGFRAFLLLALLACAFGRSANAAPLSGTRSVGPTGDYPSLTAAMADVNAVGNGLVGALTLELQAGYVSTVETFPLTIPALNGASATNTLTIRPAADATGLSISSADATAATVDLNGAQFVTFDGRPGGAGTAKQLTIENTNTAGVALRFINEASNNTLKFLTLQSVNTGATGSTVLFSTTTGLNGNDNNTIDTCDIRDGASTPANGIYSAGSTGTSAQNNSGNTVTNCNIFNFYAAAVDANGIRLDSGCTDWTITGNSFYQTATRTAVAANVRAIFLNNTSGNNFTVTGNFIGGSAPNAGGTPWTTTGTSVSYRFAGIQLGAGTTAPSSVQGNTISNIVWTSSTTGTAASSAPFIGIFVSSGNVNIGTVTGNIIGRGSGTDSISVTTSGSGGTTFGIGSTSGGTVAIANNTVSSITTNGSTSSISASLTGISVTAGTNTITNNVVGSPTNANSLNAATSSTSITAQQVTGILSSSGSSASITSNTVANLNNNYAGTSTGGFIRGIGTSAGVNTITGNTVRNLSTTSANPNTTTTQSVFGIADTSGTAGQNVSRNTVHSLANTAASAAVSVTGIYFFGPSSGGNVIARNFVHSLAVSSSSTSSVLNGMQFVTGTFTVQNNLVRVGLQADGSSTAGASTVRGIYDNGTTPGRNFYHNSVHLGGAQSSGASTTRAFDGSSGASNTRTYQNNIFINARSNGGTATSKHYVVVYSGTTVNPTGLMAGGNLFYAPNTASGGVLGLYNGADRTTLSAWQAATGQDATSAVADPLFVNPTGTSATVDLHLQATNPAEGGGIALTDALTGATVSVTDDFDGQTRSALTPADVGADAGNFALAPGDVFAPGISCPLLSSGTIASRVLTGWASILDNSGSIAGGGSAPRLYFKKSTDADVFGVANDSTGNGWKYVTATGSGPYSFTMDYSLINGGSVSIGDTIQYFVVAQDAANNLGSNPAGATASGAPAVQNVTGHGAVNSFTILSFISGTKTVGTGSDYASLTSAGGLFSVLNTSVLTGNMVVNVTSDTTETGGVTLSPLNSNDYPPYTLTIQPDSASMRTISGSATAGLITLNGADGVTIDGRFGGSGRYLTFRNTNTVNTASTILFINDSSNNTVRNCVVEGASIGGVGVIGFSTGTVTGNDNNLITANQVRDRSDDVGVPLVLIAGNGSAGAKNSGNTISNNELFNFNGIGISMGQSDENVTVSGNSIYEVNAGTGSSLRGMDFGGSGTNFITGNSIHDLVTTGGQSIGIFFQSVSTTTISRNRITAFNVNAATTDVRGITPIGSAGSILNVVNNQITLIPATSGSTLLAGIYDNGTAGTVVNAFYNSVFIGGTETGTRNSWSSFRMQTGAHVSRNNLFLNMRTGGSGSHFGAGNEGTGGSYIASNNVYAGTGATAANFMDFGSGATTPVTFATWQTGTSETDSSASNPGGNYTSAMFVDPATGDLHLIPGGNVLVNNTGTPIAGVTTDYDGDIRSTIAPNIGADEISSGLSSNADLAALSLSPGVLSPAFDGNHTTYTTNVSYGTTALTVTPTTADANATAVVSPLSPITLAVGTNTITVLVTAQDGVSTKTYTITATRNTLFQDWAASYSVANDPNNLGSNGIKNLLNFAFGADPRASGVGALVFNGTFGAGGTVGATGQPITRIEGTDIRVLFIRRADYVAAQLSYTAQFSADLVNWESSLVTPTVLADDGTVQVVGLPYPILSGGAAARFFRVQVSLP